MSESTTSAPPATKPPLLAYHGDPATKEKYIARVRAHRAAERLVQGRTWQGPRGSEKGCAIGCTLEAYDHHRYPIELGVPVELARLEDRIFEGLDVETAMAWPERFLSAIRPGADLSGVWPKFAIWLLEVMCAKSDAAKPVASLYRRRLEGSEPTRADWLAARDSARVVRDAAYTRRNKIWDDYYAARRRAAASRPEAVAAAEAAVVAEAAVAAAAVAVAVAEAEAEAEAVAEAVAAAAAVAVAVAEAEAEAEAVAWDRYWSIRGEARKKAWVRIADKLEELLSAA
jgi:hypothetical protein